METPPTCRRLAASSLTSDFVYNTRKARFNFAREFEKRYQEMIRDYNFTLDSLVLVRNSQIENELNRKVKLKYLDLMIVIRRTTKGTYILAELIDVISTLRYFAFRVISYHLQS